MTNHWRDFKNSDCILVIGANPAENHPCGWKWAHVGRDERGTRIIHVDPRFTRTSAIADVFVPIRAGTDVAFFGGLIHHVLENELYHEDYVKLHTNASFIVSEDYEFDDGLFSGYDEAERRYDSSMWDYEREEEPAEGQDAPDPGLAQGTTPAGPSFARVDPTLQDPRCVFQQLKNHFSRYTPEMVSQITGIPVDKFLAVADEFGATGTADKVGSVVYAVGLTQHTSGLQIIRGIGILQMLLGNVGRHRRRRQRRAWPRQHPGQHGQRDLLGDPPRLSRHPPSGDGDDGRLPRSRSRQAAPPQLGQLLRVELQEVPRQHPQGVLRRRQRRRTTSTAMRGSPSRPRTRRG